MSTSPDTPLHERPAEILQRLIRFDTTNPPGRERACVEWVKALVRDLPGVQPTLIAKDPDRPSLIARLAGRGEAPPLLMQGHIDVVPAVGDWTHPPFGGDIAMGRLGRFLAAIDQRRLPAHITPVPRMMIEAMADALPKAFGAPLRLLLRPRTANRLLDVMGARASFLDPLLHNTVSPTVVRGGHAANVIPGEVSVDLDCRLLPGFEPEDIMRELRELSGVDVAFEVLRFDPGPPAPDMGLYNVLSGILSELDPTGTPVPL